MQWQPNRYYSLTYAEEEGIQIAAAILQAYPLTRACLEILGDDLLSKLEFGFFSAGTEIIRQGESGKDLFLLCEGQVDVLVDGQMVVQMQAPRLLGDKAIVEPNSKRAATIRISPGSLALFLKIPMGLFIRNFDDASIPDSQFQQEVGIYSNVFQGIQQRLFEYIYLQKNLWDEVNTTLNVINSQAIAKSLDAKKDLGWDEAVWGIVKKAIMAELKFNWPENIPLHIQTCRDVLERLLDVKFPRNTFQGKNEDYLARRQVLWRSWLLGLGNQLIKILPNEKLPFRLDDIELFNPLNYRMRMYNFLRGVEKKFPLRTAQAVSIFQTTPTTLEAPPVENFFGKGERANEFNLNGYLASFEETFALSRPKRTQAQLAQRAALVAAECENQFNTSVAKMQRFLEKTKNVAVASAKKQDKQELATHQLTKYANTLLKSFQAYNRTMPPPPQKNVGEIQYIWGFIPNIEDLIKCSGSKTIRAELEQAFQQLIEIFGIRGRLLSHQLKQNLFLCEANPSDLVTTEELGKQYWMPISPGISLICGEENWGTVKPGLLLGGKGWEQHAKKGGATFNLKMPSRQSTDPMDLAFLLFVFPPSKFLWETEKEASSEVFFKEYVPLMQWWVYKHLEHMNFIAEQRDIIYQKWFEITQVVKVEQRIKEFENTKTRLSQRQQTQIAILLKRVINLEIEVDAALVSDALAKRIYNHILRQMNQDYPELKVEERSNKAYTKWRFILSEIVQLLDRLSSPKQNTDSENPRPIFQILTTELGSVIETYTGDKGEKYLQLTQSPPQFALAMMFQEMKTTSIKTRIMLFKLMSAIFETHLCKLYQEHRDYLTKWQQLSALRPQGGTETIQLEMIHEQTQKLHQVLQTQAA